MHRNYAYAPTPSRVITTGLIATPKPEKSLAQSLSILAGRFHLKKKLGNGSFGEVWLVVDAQSRKEYAVKLENVNVNFL